MRIERLEGSFRPSAIPLVVLNELIPTEKQTTNESGTATFEKSGSTFMVNPSGRNCAYNNAYVKATWSGAKVLYPGEHREIWVARKDGVIEIPLRRRSIGGEKLLPEKSSANSLEENRWESDTGDVAQHDNQSGIADAHPGN